MADGELLDPDALGLTDETPARESRWLRAPKQKVEFSDDEKIYYITNLEPREKKWGYIVAAIQAAVAVLLSAVVIAKRPVTTTYAKVTKDGTCPVPYSTNPDKHATAAQHCYFQTEWSPTSVAVFVGAMVALTLFLALSARRGRRSLAIVAGTLTAFAMLSTSFLFMVPFAAYAAALFIRSYKLQQETGGRAATLVRNREARAARVAARKSGTRASTRTSSKPAAAGTKGGPSANKRYTPKAPQKKPTKPAN